MVLNATNLIDHIVKNIPQMELHFMSPESVKNVAFVDQNINRFEQIVVLV